MTADIDTVEPARSHSPTALAEDFPEAVVDSVAHVLHKPRARGWIHVYAAVIALVAGAALVSVAWAVESTRAQARTAELTTDFVGVNR